MHGQVLLVFPPLYLVCQWCSVRAFPPPRPGSLPENGSALVALGALCACCATLPGCLKSAHFFGVTHPVSALRMDQSGTTPYYCSVVTFQNLHRQPEGWWRGSFGPTGPTLARVGCQGVYFGRKKCGHVPLRHPSDPSSLVLVRHVTGGLK